MLALGKAVFSRRIQAEQRCGTRGQVEDPHLKVHVRVELSFEVRSTVWSLANECAEAVHSVVP